MKTPEHIPWEAIKKFALLGTDRSNLSPEVMKFFDAVGTDADQTEDRVLLDGLTQAAFVFRTARKYPKKNIPSLPDSLQQKQNAPPPREVGQMVDSILHGEFREMLFEYLQCLHDRNWSFPPDQLPGLLNECLENPALWSSIYSHIDPLAHWLITLNPAWSSLKRDPEESSWKSKFPADKLRYYRKLRDLDLDQANELLLQSWSSFSAKTKVQFLDIISEEPKESDFQLFKSMPKEKSKKVNIALFELQVKNPGSEISDKARNFFQKNVKLPGAKNKAPGKIKINLPELDDAQALNLIPQHSYFPGGVRANYLAQIIYALPLSFLENELSQPASAIVNLFFKSEWNVSLLQAIILKSVDTKNQIWLSAIFSQYFNDPNATLWQETSVSLIYTSIDQKTFEELVPSSALDGIKVIQQEGPLTNLLQEYSGSWPNTVTFTFFKLVKEWLQKDPQYWMAQHIWEIVKVASFKTNPLELPRLRNAFQKDQIWLVAEEEINNFLSVLSLRYRLYKEYDE